VAWLQKWKWEVLPHSSDLAPSDFYLFGPFKNFLSERRLEDEHALQIVVVQYFTSLEKVYYHEGMFKLVKG
jgi:hypothetical protein